MRAVAKRVVLVRAGNAAIVTLEVAAAIALASVLWVALMGGAL